MQLGVSASARLPTNVPAAALLSIPSPHSSLRHLFISYQVAQVALEAGHSPQMVFKRCRELVRPTEAEAWFSILAAEKQSAESCESLCEQSPGEGTGPTTGCRFRRFR